jgi:hypothetical protein
MKFNFRTLTHSPERLNVVSAKLGTDDLEKYTDSDIGKPMKLGAEPGCFVVVADGDEIEGFLDNIDAGGTTDGHVFGGVACGTRGFRVEAEFSGDAGAVGDLVVAAAQSAIGVKAASGLGKVKAGTPTTHKWRIIANKTPRASAAVNAADIVVLELL